MRVSFGDPVYTGVVLFKRDPNLLRQATNLWVQPIPPLLNPMYFEGEVTSMFRGVGVCAYMFGGSWGPSRHPGTCMFRGTVQLR